MRPLSLRMQNTYSHESSYVNLRNKHLALIVGEIDGVEGNSNTAGKTSIIRAIEFCLFGVSDSGVYHVIRDFTDEARVVFIFRGDDENIYKVERSVKVGKNSSISMQVSFFFLKDKQWIRKENDLIKGSNGIKIEIQKVVGMDADVFRHSVRLQRKDIGSFAVTEASERRKIFKKFIDLSKWDGLEGIAKIRKEESETALESEKRIAEDLSTRIEDVETLKKALRLGEEKVSKDEGSQNECIAKIAELEARLEKTKKVKELSQRVDFSKREIRILKNLANELGQTIETTKEAFKKEIADFKSRESKEVDLRSSLKELNDKLNEFGDLETSINLKSTIVASIRENLSNKEKACAVFQSQIQALADTKKRVLAIDGICPTCLSELKEEHKNGVCLDLKEKFESLKEKRNLLHGELKDLKSRLGIELDTEKSLNKSLVVRVGYVAEISSIEFSLKKNEADRKSLLTKRDVIKKQLEKSTEKKNESISAIAEQENRLVLLQAEYDLAKKDTEDFSDMVSVIETCKSKLAAIETNIATGRTAVGSLMARIENAEKLEKELKSKYASIDSLQKEFNIRKLVHKSLGKQGIQAIILENSINYFEVIARKYLKRFTNDRYDLRLETTVSNQKNDNVREVLDILIDKGNGIWHPYESFSGGETMKIDLALRVGLALLSASFSSVRPEYLYIDEIAGSLDGFQRKVFMEMLLELSKDFDLILVVTHFPEMQEEFKDIITVKKTGYISKIVDSDPPEPEDFVEELVQKRKRKSVDDDFCSGDS